MFEILWVACVVYGVTILLTEYDGPFSAFYRLRQTKLLRKVMACPACLGVWVAAVTLVVTFDPLSTVAGYGLFLFAWRNEV